MTTIHHLTNKAIAVTGLPEGAYDFEVKQMGSMFDYHYILTYKTPFRWEKFGKRNYEWNTRSEKPLTILGFSQDLKEYQWATIVERSYRFPDHYLFHDYTSESTRWAYLLKTAIEAGHSLLKSKDLDPLLNHLILIQ